MKNDEELAEIWRQSSSIDLTLKNYDRHWHPLLRRRLAPEPFSRQLLFRRMAGGEPLLATGLKVPVRGEERLGKQQAVLRALTDGLPRNERVCVRLGPTGVSRRIAVRELIRLWSNGRAKLTVTDLHLRKSSVLRYMDCTALSDFNLLVGASKEVASEEMLTAVVSSAKTFTDSHTDDPDGSNHCFVGRKLWLVWDTFMGIKQGIQDFERCDVLTDRAAFDIGAFLSIPGSRWFLVEPGQTLFLPGNFAHKVITLEHYLGVGSFFVMLPSYLRTLERWTLHTPLWALDLPEERRMDIVNRITRRVLHKVLSLSNASHHEQLHWGLDPLERAANAWNEGKHENAKRALLAQPPTRDLVQALLKFESNRSPKTRRKAS